MFLDDKLNEIVENRANYETDNDFSRAIIKTIVSEIPNPEKVSIQEYINKLRQIEFSFQLFCKRNKGMFKSDWFRNFVLESAGEHKEMFRKALKWDK